MGTGLAPRAIDIQPAHDLTIKSLALWPAMRSPSETQNGRAMARPLVPGKGHVKRPSRYFAATGSGTGVSESVCR